MKANLAVVLALDLLGRHVGPRPAAFRRVLARLQPERSAQAEVRQLHRPVKALRGPQQDVVGLEVPVHQIVCVEIGQGLENLAHDDPALRFAD